MGVTSIKYCTDEAALEKLLFSVDRPGDYCVGGRLLVLMPRMLVKGAGELSFPVPERQVRALIAAAERAPYGKGLETVLDRSVRDCWQIDAEKVRIAGRAWPDTFSKIVEAAAEGLGLPGERLDARLYKLLVYEKGGFFSAHRDTEKASGMVATLSVSLPVRGKGGELVVRHEDREVVMDMNADEPSEVAFAAFYTDCVHEVRPVLEGHRLSLVFNLCLRASDSETLQSAPGYAGLADRVAEGLAKWRSSGKTDKLVWVLDHEYSEAGLSFDALKGTDAALARVLGPAAENAGCEVHAAIVHIHEVGAPDYNAGFYHDGWTWREPEVADMTMGDLAESWCRLDSWAGRDGGKPPFGDVPLRDFELLPQGALDAADPDEKSLERSMGNEGDTLEHMYRHAAFVIWPTEKTVDVVASGSINNAVAWVSGEFERSPSASDGRLGRLLSRLIDVWSGSWSGGDKKTRLGMLRLLERTGDQGLAARFLQEIVLEKYDGREDDRLPPVLGLAGPRIGGEVLSALAGERFCFQPQAVLAFLRRLDEGGREFAGPAWRGELGKAVAAALVSVPQVLAGRRRKDEPSHAERRKKIDGDGIRDLFVLAWRHGRAAEAETAARHVVAHPKAVNPGRMLPAALNEMHREDGLAGSAAYARLWNAAADFLLARSATPPQEPRDWAIAAKTGCDCEHCAKLLAFCADPDVRTARFPLRKDLRRHLHRVIDKHRLDVYHVTERRGRPYTLVCTKNRAGYERRLTQYAEDVLCMRSLAGCTPSGGREETDAGRAGALHAALERAAAE